MRIRGYELAIGFMLGVVVFSIAAIFLSVFDIIPREICEQDGQTNKKECATYGVPFVLAWSISKSLNWIAPLIGVFAAIAVAYFTWMLKRSTDNLWATSEKQIGLSRESSEIQLRSYVHIEKVDVIGKLSGDEAPTFKIRFKNYGHTPAHRISNSCGLTTVFEGTPKSPKRKTTHHSDLGPSQGRTTNLWYTDEEWKIASFGPRVGAGSMFLVGEITYFDAFQMRTGNVSVPRSTKYCFLVNEGDKGGIILTVADEGNESN